MAEYSSGREKGQGRGLEARQVRQEAGVSELMLGAAIRECRKCGEKIVRVWIQGQEVKTDRSVSGFKIENAVLKT